ncbi:MAG: putative toxin-antitoxin system toxin component, PIN family [Bradyrhizobium sp.]
MRVVVDTNIFVSAALKQGSLPYIALYQASQRCVLLKSVVTEAQFFEVMARPYFADLIAPEARDWLTQIMAAAELVVIMERRVECRDPTDDKFFDLAVNSRADRIVTGDKDLLVLNPFQGIPIVSPATFVQGAAR